MSIHIFINVFLKCINTLSEASHSLYCFFGIGPITVYSKLYAVSKIAIGPARPAQCATRKRAINL